MKNKTKNSIKSIALILAVVAIIGSFGGLFNGSGSGSGSNGYYTASAQEYKDLQKFVGWQDTNGKIVSARPNYRYKADAEKLINLSIPKDIQKEYFEDYEDNCKMSRQELIAEMEDSMETASEGMKNLKVKIIKAEKLNKLDELGNKMRARGISDLDDLVENLENRYEDYDFDASKVKQAYAVEVEVKWKQDGEQEDFESTHIVYKYKGKWYLYDVMF